MLLRSPLDCRSPPYQRNWGDTQDIPIMVPRIRKRALVSDFSRMQTQDPSAGSGWRAIGGDPFAGGSVDLGERRGTDGTYSLIGKRRHHVAFALKIRARAPGSTSPQIKRQELALPAEFLGILMLPGL